jgi:anti-sigma regulatory factor (Ser/Thr protein kinase)
VSTGALGEVTVHGRPEFVGVLRNFAQDLVRAVHPEAADAAQLITSELAGNCVKFSPRSLEPGETVRLRVVDEGVKISMTDRGGGATTPAVVEDDAFGPAVGVCGWFSCCRRSGGSRLNRTAVRRCGAGSLSMHRVMALGSDRGGFDSVCAHRGPALLVL